MNTPQQQHKSEKAVSYERVSSREQAQGYSLRAQAEESVQYAQKHDLRVVRAWNVTESAKDQGRKNFDDMVIYLKAHPEVKHLLVEKVDRLNRNFGDAHTIMGLVASQDLHVHFFHEGWIFHKESPVSDYYRLGIMTVMATGNTYDMRDKVRKGMLRKALEGRWPNRGPFGLRNDKLNKRLVIAPEEAPWVMRVMELAATGRYSLRAIAETIWKEGCPKKLSWSYIAYMIRHKLYSGTIEFKGVVSKSLEPILVTPDLQARAIAGLERQGRAKYNSMDWRLKGMLRCSVCNCAIVAELKKGHYYCRCGRNSPSRPCTTKGGIRLELLDAEVERLLRSIQLGPELADKTLEYLEQSAPFEAAEKLSRLVVLKQERERTISRKEKLLDLLADGKLSEPDWNAKRNEYDARLTNMNVEIKHLDETAPSAYIPLARSMLELSNGCENIYKSMTDEKKRELLRTLHLNLTLDGKNIVPAWRKPFDIIAKLAPCAKPWAVQDLNL